jgi:hypothetical protein
VAQEAKNESPDQHVVVLIHGIRTHAPWAELVKLTLEASPAITSVIPIGYGYFDILRFLIPGPWRKTPVERIVKELNEIRERWPRASISILAHSYGTYAVTRALWANPHIKLRYLALCGAIVPADFPWGRVAGFQVREHIVNDCGTNDIWPVIANHVTSGYGATGTFGCRTSHVVDRFHPFRHSDFFSKDFAERYWRPLFSENRIVWPEGTSDVPRKATPWWQSALATVRLFWIAAAAAALAATPPLLRLFNESTPPPTAFTEDVVSDLEVGYTRGYFTDKLGNPRVERSGLLQCASSKYDASYAEWADRDIAIQAIFVGNEAVLLVYRLLREPGRDYRFKYFDWSLGSASFEEIEARPPGIWFEYPSGRWPNYNEAAYFGGPGGYHGYYFSHTHSGPNLSDGWTFEEYLAEASRFDAETPSPDYDLTEAKYAASDYKLMRQRTRPSVMAMESLDKIPECSPILSDGQGSAVWQGFVSAVIALPTDWTENDLEDEDVWTLLHAESIGVTLPP